jgi:hypothetical protein
MHGTATAALVGFPPTLHGMRFPLNGQALAGENFTQDTTMTEKSCRSLVKEE